jgi:hypothetical protein
MTVPVARRPHVVLAVSLAIALALTLAARAGSPPPDPPACGPSCGNGKVSICHRDGLATNVPLKEQTLCLPENAAAQHVTQAGSQAGHEFDICGICPSDQQH